MPARSSARRDATSRDRRTRRRRTRRRRRSASSSTQHAVDLIVLAGYLRLVPADIVGHVRGRIINVHPALLPAFGGTGMYGQRVHHAVIEAGVRVTGVTAHFVDDVVRSRPDHRAVAGAGVRERRRRHARGARAARRTPRVSARRRRSRRRSHHARKCAETAGRDAIVDVRPSFTLLPHEDSRLAENIELALGC